MRRFLLVVILLTVLFGCAPKENYRMPGLSPLAIEFTATSGQAIDFRHLPRIINQSARSISVWIYQDTAAPSFPNLYNIAGVFSDEAGFLFYTREQRLLYYQKYLGNSGRWTTPAASLPLASWTHVLATYSRGLLNDPVLYINNVAQAVTEEETPAGVYKDETGDHLMIGSVKTATLDYTWNFDGKIFDVRIYNTILTQAEVTAIYNGGVPSVSAGTRTYDPATKTGLVFQSFAVRTGELADFVDQSLTGLKVLDGQFLAVGEVSGIVTGRAAPAFIAGGAILKNDGGGLLLMSGGRLMEYGRLE